MTFLSPFFQTVWAKIGLAVVALVLVAALIFGVVNHYKQTFEIREAQREVERGIWDAEKHALEVERGRLRGQLDEMEAMNAALSQVAESKRADRATVVKELELIELQHEQRKADAEATGSSLPTADLVRQLCARMRARGIKCAE